MIVVYLIHPEGPDGDALAAYLERRGISVERTVPVQAPKEPTEVVVVHEELAVPELGSVGRSMIVLGNARPLDFEPDLRIAEPYFLERVADAASHASKVRVPEKREVPPPESVQPPAPPMSAPAPDPKTYDEGPTQVQPEPTPMPLQKTNVAVAEPSVRKKPDHDADSEMSLVLRGIAHALNNPLGAASGWLQLLELERDGRDQPLRALDQARAELERIEVLLRAIALIGGRPSSLRAPIPLVPLLEERVLRLQSQGMTVQFDPPAEEEVTGFGDPLAFGLMLDLLFDSFLDDRSVLGRLGISVKSDGKSIACTLMEDAGLFPIGEDPCDLGLLLRDTRHGRALGIGLCVRLVEEEMGGRVHLEPDRFSGTRLRMTMPRLGQSGDSNAAGRDS